MRPRISPELTAALQVAAGLAGLTVNKYFELVLRPFVEADMRRRLEDRGLSKAVESEDGSAEAAR